MFKSYTEKLYRPNLKSNEPHNSKIQVFSCDMCDGSEDGSVWFNETDLEVHRKETHWLEIKQTMTTYENRFCTICMTLENHRSTLISHIKSRHLLSSPQAHRVEREIFICNHCNRVFFNKGVLEVHIMSVHMWTPEQRKCKKFECPKCQKTIQIKSLWYHLQYHEIPSISVCDICLKVCDNAGQLMSHCKEHMMYFYCDICDYQTVKEHLFQSHVDRHRQTPYNKNEVRVLQKRTLKNVFRKDNSMNVNIQKYNMHNSLKGLALPNFMHICTLCREICITKTEMAEHIVRDHFDNPKPEPKPSFHCQCGEQYHSKVLLKHHIFKLKGDHAEATDDCPMDTTVDMTVDAGPLGPAAHSDEPDTAAPVQCTTTEDTAEYMEIVVPVEIDENKNIKSESDENEIVYVYADDSGDEILTVDQNSERVVSF